ncbi:histidine phosphatase family protein [Acinetobacter sp. ANC 4779]|uniref:histidine phosphatase family protein n=1 Tax=Acinetobacter sp. ANC 4779 TaxID=2529848 RepID=UPI00103E2807|nr:histidine phosphatase family protein [Acinetobacter sp. ANC 4779]TCB50634.1 histidine phosphatase family protein [Acinetobacter sp. ANC 4779]
MLKIDLLRHGETTLSHTLRGSTDDDLTELGWSQMQQTIDQFLHFSKQASLQNNVQWDVIFSSPLKRCRLFAETVAEQKQRPIFYDAGLQEMHFGDWEGISTQVIYENEPELLANFWQQPSQFTPPNAENMQDFYQRICTSLEKMKIQMLENEWQHALVVTHGGVIKLLKCIALNHSLDEILKMTAELGKLNSFAIYEDASIHLLKE